MAGGSTKQREEFLSHAAKDFAENAKQEVALLPCLSTVGAAGAAKGAEVGGKFLFFLPGNLGTAAGAVIGGVVASSACVTFSNPETWMKAGRAAGEATDDQRRSYEQCVKATGSHSTCKPY